MTTDIDALVERLEMEWFFPDPSAAAKKVEAVLAQRKEAAQALTRLSDENARLRAENAELIGLPEGFKRLADLPVDFKSIMDENARLREAGKAFVDAYDACKPDIEGAFQMAWIHGFRYEGRPTYGKELEALRAALQGDV